MLAVKGYDGDRFREDRLLSNILPVIPPRSNRKAAEIATIVATPIAIVLSACPAVSSTSAASPPASRKPHFTTSASSI
jgi:hypothetical protein